jgi:hypothetical protein
MKYMQQELKLPANLMLQDQGVVFGLALMPLYIREQFVNPDVTIWMDIEGAILALGFTAAFFALAFAYRYAKGGNIMAIENTKGLV